MSEDRELLHANLRALARHPHAIRALDGVEPYPDDHVLKARTGDPVIQLAGPDGNVRPLHSRYRPREEAAGQVDVDEDPLTSYLFLGAGFGYGLLELLPRVSTSNALLWVEPDARLFRTLLGRVDLTELLNRLETYVVVAGGKERFFRFLHDLSWVVLGSPLKLVVHPPSQQLHPDLYEEYRIAINEFMREGAVRLRTAFYLSRISLANQVRNLSGYLGSPGIAPLAGALAGQPAVIVSAGPSLRKNMSLLREVQGRVTIISVSTTLKRLLAQDIQPDLTVLIDYHDVSRRYFEDIPPAAAPPMVVETKATVAGVEAYQGRKLFGNDLFFNTLFDGLIQDKGTLPPSSTVAHAAFHVAKHMGADPIVLIGQDLAYSGGFMHVPGTAIQTQIFPQTHRFYSMETRELEYYLTNRPRFTKVPAIPAGEVPTCDVFLTYLKEFELLIADHAGRVIDATEGGARIAGTEVESLSDVLARYRETTRPDLTALLDEASGDLDADEVRSRAVELLEQRRDELGQLRDIYAKMLEILPRVIEANERGRAADDEAQRVLALHEESQRYDRIYLLLSQLPQSDLWERKRQDRRIDASGAEGVARQLEQARRDHEFVLGLSHAAEFLADCLTTAHSTIESEIGSPDPS